MAADEQVDQQWHFAVAATVTSSRFYCDGTYISTATMHCNAENYEIFLHQVSSKNEDCVARNLFSSSLMMVPHSQECDWGDVYDTRQLF